jgi:hypothetical protein
MVIESVGNVSVIELNGKEIFTKINEYSGRA